MREFHTGATRDDDEEKLDYEGFLSPIALKRYAEYMHEHREQVDGRIRDSDNWQKGIPKDAYMKSMFRHMMDLWANHRDPGELGAHGSVMADIINIKEEALCAILFNAFGYLHESLRGDEPLDKLPKENWGSPHLITSTHGDKE